VNLKRFKPFVMALAIVASLAVCGYQPVATSGQRRLSNSVDVLLTEHLRLDYEVRKSVVLDSGFDVNGAWWIELDAASADILASLQRSQFELADDFDLSSFKKDAERWFAPHHFDAGYQLFVAEMPLGRGTACEKLHCNIKVLIKPGEKNVLVQLFNT
jgi:hypothetical protein